jgi:hypothetical protein
MASEFANGGQVWQEASFNGTHCHERHCNLFEHLVEDIPITHSEGILAKDSAAVGMASRGRRLEHSPP